MADLKSELDASNQRVFELTDQVNTISVKFERCEKERVESAKKLTNLRREHCLEIERYGY
jgi:hypothetical protein